MQFYTSQQISGSLTSMQVPRTMETWRLCDLLSTWTEYQQASLYKHISRQRKREKVWW